LLREIAAELIIIYAFLELDQDTIELHIKIGALLNHLIQAICCRYCRGNLLEELTFGRIISDCCSQLVKVDHLALDHHGNLLLLLFKGLILGKVLLVLGCVVLEHFLLANGARVDFHHFLDCVKLLMHGDTIVHDLFLSLSYVLKLVHLVFNR